MFWKKDLIPINQGYKFSSAQIRVTAIVLKAVMLGGILFFGSWFAYFAVSTIVLPFQIEHREGVTQVMAWILMSGGNPFAFENQPLAMNNYGIVYPLLITPFAMLFGNTLIVHRAITLLFIILSSAASFLALRKKDNDVYFPGLCAILMAIILSGRAGLGAFPSSTGFFFFLTAMLVPFHRSFDNRGLFISILASLAAFYTKPYFVLSFGIVASYLFLFISKKRGVLYTLFFTAIFAVVFIPIRYFLNLYYVNVFIGNISNIYMNASYLADQLKEIYIELFPSLLAAGLLLIFEGRNYLKKEAGERRTVFNFAQPDSALISLRLDYFLYILIIGFLVFVFVLGRHTGNYMTYAYHIVVLPFLLWLFKKSTMEVGVAVFTVPCFLLNAACISQTLINPSFLEQKNSMGWLAVRQYAQDSDKILNSPEIVSIIIEAGGSPVDSGQTEYYFYVKPYNDIPLLAPDYKAVRQNGLRYQWALKRAIANREYDRVILTEERRSKIVSLDDIEQYYVKVDTVLLDMPQSGERNLVGVWEPIISP
jgi:hypothetical protein